MKIDVEHYDQLVLQDLFEAGIHPPYISAEAHRLEVFDWLLSLGYLQFKLLPGPEVGANYAERDISLLDGTRGRHVFPPLSSGPFGEEVDGAWLDRADLLKALSKTGLGWVDIHARN